MKEPIDGRLGELGYPRPIIDRYPIDRLAVMSGRRPAADRDEPADEIARDRFVVEHPARASASEGGFKGFEGGKDLRFDDRTLLEREALMIDRVRRADSDAVPASPAPLRMSGMIAALIGLKNLGDRADIYTGVTTDTCSFVNGDLCHVVQCPPSRL